MFFFDSSSSSALVLLSYAISCLHGTRRTVVVDEMSLDEVSHIGQNRCRYFVAGEVEFVSN